MYIPVRYFNVHLGSIAQFTETLMYRRYVVFKHFHAFSQFETPLFKWE